MTGRAYLPLPIITHKGSVFVSRDVYEVAEILGKNLNHAATNYAQTIGVIERADFTIKAPLKLASGEYWKQWHRFLPIAILKYNTTNVSRIDCEPSRVFHGEIPQKILDHKLGLRFNPITMNFADELLCRNEILYDKTEINIRPTYIKYKKMRQKSKSFPFKRERLLLRISTKGRISSVKSTVS